MGKDEASVKTKNARHKAKSILPRRMMVSAVVIVVGIALAIPLAIGRAVVAGPPQAAPGAEAELAASARSDAHDTSFGGTSLNDLAESVEGSLPGLKRSIRDAVDSMGIDVFSLKSADMLSIEGSESVVSVNLSPSSTRADLDPVRLQPVEAALSEIREEGPCGFVFIDVGTGHGLAYNSDEAVYIASSSKAVFAYYALTRGAGESSYQRDNIESAIVYSDNDAYEAFGYSYFDNECGDWMERHGVGSTVYQGDLYPRMSARSLASFWVDILHYLEAGSEDAVWFGDLLSRTSVSFIRDGLEGSGAAVMNKAGWIADWEADSVSDAAIVKADGRTYLMVIVTGMPAWESTEASVSTLASALFALRDTL